MSESEPRRVLARQVIDRRSYEPVYSQLVNILEQQIAAGIYRPGDQLPSEAQLCEQYGVSAMTVRRAVNILVQKGLVSTAQGRGTFVKGFDLGEAVFQLVDLKRHISRRDITSIRLLEARMVTADERVSRKLAIPLGQRAIYIRRLLLEEGVPTIYHREYLIYDPTRPVVEAELEVTSLEGLFHGQENAGLKKGELTIEAVTLREEEAALLLAPVGSAAFALEHIFYDFEDQPVSWGWFICRGDHFKLRTVLGAHEERQGRRIP